MEVKPTNLWMMMVHLAFLLICLTGCAGSGGDGGSPPQITGVAAAGLPLAGTVTIKDSSTPTKQLSSTIAEDGSFSFDVTGLAPPFLLQATGSAAGVNYTLHSLSSNPGTCNINPLTDLAVTMANGGQTPADLFANPSLSTMRNLASTLPTSLTSLQTTLTPLFESVGASPHNIINDKYTADRQGLDMLFDIASINVSNGSVSIIDKQGGEEILPSTPITSGLLTGSPDSGKLGLRTITGNVKTLSGAGIPGVVVTAYPFLGCGGPIAIPIQPPPSSKSTDKNVQSPSLQILPHVKTDSAGNYTLYVQRGRYWIVSSLAGYGLTQDFIEVVIDTTNVTGKDFTADYGGKGMFAYPSAITIDKNDTIYVADVLNSNIQKFSSDGTYLGQWGKYGTNGGQFTYTTLLGTDTSGNIYAGSNYYDNDISIQKFSNDGRLIAQWGRRGTGDGEFSYLSAFTIDKNNILYALDNIIDNPRLQKFNSNGEYLSQWSMPDNGSLLYNFYTALAVGDSGSLYMANNRNKTIQKFNSNGQYLSQWGTPGTGDGQFSTPSAIAVDRDDNVYVVDRHNNRIQKFSSSGEFIMGWGSYGSDNGQFKYPSAAAIDKNGNIYVVDDYNYRIQKFSSNGEYLGQWGMYGTLNPSPPSFACPT
ncbi:6-bladed beta-propeller [Geobacter sp. SVR]|uniref:6-bladed beta-propeller n=1 Tax=Geobacter sp. SVR TaxID=2495594 RepID=UPI00143EFD7C|nr:6-bladed beta-propeller [Geobacter sp. SVR]BCS53146.1 hypothetical protein GSVR_14540 [Geobacter sp. SVR]GCF84531.1 hypothetical protein GSbR_11310 [Geobacter sp. SVR]